MNYTVFNNRPFVTKKALKRTAPVSKVSVAIEKFMKTHDVSIEFDPATQRPITIVTEKHDEQ